MDLQFLGGFQVERYGETYRILDKEGGARIARPYEADLIDEIVVLRKRLQKDGYMHSLTSSEARDFQERLSARLHDVYQKEAHRRGDVRHPDRYEDLSESTKEWDRVLARWIMGYFEPLFDPREEIPPP